MSEGQSRITPGTIRIIGTTVAVTLVVVVVIMVIVTAGSGPSRTAAPVRSASAAAPAPAVQAPALPPGVRAHLDQGNTAYRAGRMDEALTHYRAAAAAAPGDAAPYFGIYMAATALHNKSLADSALAEIQARSGNGGQALTDSSIRQMHAGGARRAP